MNQQSRDLRREANRAFLESLQALGADSPAPPAAATRPPSPVHPPADSRSSTRPERDLGIGFDPSDLEQAIADIEQYLQQQAG